MEKRAPYSRVYSLVFAAVTVVAAAVALVRRDGMVTMAAAILGLYILHVLSLRAVVRESATPSTSRSSRAHAREPRQPNVSSRPAASSESNASSKTEMTGPVFVSSASGFVREVGAPSVPTAPRRQRPATEDREWMLHLGDSEEEPEFLPVSSDSPPLSASGTQAATGSTDPTTTAAPDVVVPRKFAIGTVAIIRRALDPGQVARVLEEQRKFPKKRFGELAVERGFIEEAQLEELLGVQKAGLFTEAEIQWARTALESYRREQPSATV
ncbi:MAG: hypothetical protein KAJ67_10610 [Gemmatimonadetes bacterium]|nr:hypothetical protein [Gemmatimonadota bacterium]